MADMTNFAQLLEKLAAADSPSAQAAVVAESAFAQLDPTVALVARCCIVLRWFDPLIVATFLPATSETETAFTPDAVINHLAQLPFVERLPWGWTYHEQSRTGLLDRYATEQPDLLKQAALLAAPAYQQHSNQALAGQEALFCWLVAGDLEKAQQQLDRLIDEAWGRNDWNGLLALFTTSDQAAKLNFVQSLHYTAFHHYAQAVALRQLGNYEGSVAAFQQAIALDAQFAYPWNGLGNAYYAQKRNDEAIAAYQQAIARNDKLADPWNNLGLVYHDQQRYDDAIAAYQQAVARDDKFAYAWNNLGLVYRDQQRYNDAITAFQQAIARDDKDASPWNNLGLVYRDQQRYNDAITAFQQAIAHDDKDASPWNSLGNVYYDQHRYDDAIAACQQAIARDDKYAYPWNNLGLVYYHQQRYDDAVAAFQQAIVLNDKDADYWVNLGVVYYDQKHYDDAIAAFQQAIALNDKDVSLHRRLTGLCRLRERWSDAEASIRHALTLEPTDGSLWCGLADILRRRGDQASWQEALTQAQLLIDYTNFYNAACFESVAGNEELALALLAQAAAKVGFNAAWAQVDPDLEWIRHDPRFAQIVNGA